MSQIWITRRKGKTGIRYLVRWIEPMSGANRGKTFKRRQDAESFKVKTRKDIDENNYFAPVKISFDEWRLKHVESLHNSSESQVAAKTIESHKEALESLAQACEPKRLIDIDPRMIREFRRKMLDRSKSPNTINKHIRTIRSSLSYAVRNDYLQKNKLLGPHRLELKCDKTRGRVLEVGEVLVLMNMADSLSDKLVLSLAYYHGLCKGEIVWLRWEDVDTQAYRLTVMDQAGHRLKTKNRSRSVALRKETADLIGQLYPDWVNEYIFEKPMTVYHEIKDLVPKLAKKAGLDHCTLHDLRRTCNTMMKDQGKVTEEVVTQVTGNTQGVNRRHYTSELKKQQRIAVDSLPSIG